jgi:polar amino acid transport system substrate-binding protein
MAKVGQPMLAMLHRGLVIMVLLILVGSPAVRAEHVLDRIERTGIFNAGSRADAVPFGYRYKKGQLAGFSVDLLGEIHRRLEKRFGRPLKLQLHEVIPANRMELVMNGTINIECGVTTPTWTREAQVDFSIPFFGNGTRIMTLESTATHLQDLKGKHIGVAAGATTAAILAEHVPEVITVEVPDMATGFERFRRGELDGLANIGIVLRAMVEGSPLKSKVILLPRSGIFSYETMACILPSNDSAWRDFVNHTLAELLAGVDEYRGAYMEIYERWFGPRGVVYFPLDYATAQRLAASVIWLR